MSSLAITNIGSLITNDESRAQATGVNPKLGELTNAAIVFENGRVAWVGASNEVGQADECIDAEGKAVIPGFVDSHAHLMFAGDRSAEFEARMQGSAYSAGGINSTVEATRSASDKVLQANLEKLIAEMHSSGITTFETKSGYGLTAKDESRSLQIAKQFTSETTFLGAHVTPKEFREVGETGTDKTVKTDKYIELITGEMLTASAPHAKWVDVFCDRGAFDVDQAREIFRHSMSAGLAPRIHANQIENIGAIQLAVELDCASADHCTHLSDKDIDLLAGSNTVATLLPGAEFSTRSQYPDARRLIAAGATVALATDCNPGSSFTTSMSFCIAVAVREMNMTPAEALWSATAGGAQALRRSDVGNLKLGSMANFVILDAPSHLHLSYRPGVNLIQSTYINAKKVASNIKGKK